MKTKNTILNVFLTLLFVLAVVGVKAQSHAKAEEQMKKYEFISAIESYQQHFLTHDATPQEIRNITYCYMQINDNNSAVKWLAKIINSANATAEDIKIYADLLKTEGKYTEAIAEYQKLKSLYPTSADDADMNIKSCNDAISWINEPTLFVVKNEEKFNSDKSDFGLIAYGDNFFLTSDRVSRKVPATDNNVYGWTGNPYLKLYEVEMNNTEVKEIDYLKDLNDQFHNGPGVFADNNKKIYFTRTKTVKQIQKTTNPDPTSWFIDYSNEINTNRLAIYSAKYSNGKWDDIESFENNNTELYSVGHPALSVDEKIMYFVSDMIGGFGETDIYYCEKRIDGTWGEPHNAGPEINSAGKELFPFIDKEGNLYFSSNGHAGMGGLDLFKTVGSKDKWSKPENLKYPINSSKDDFSIYVVETDSFGYFASNRSGGIGSDDIYSFTYIPEPPKIPTQLILSVETYERLEDGTLVPIADVDIHYHVNNEGNAFPIESYSPGIYYATVACDTRYLINGAKTGYFSTEKEVETKCETMNDTLRIQLVFDKIIVNKPIVIENIYYDYDKWEIRRDAAVELDKIVHLLKENPQIIIELGSHTDSRGAAKYNEELSQKRAEAAVEYIVSRGISKDRITAKGYGERFLVNKCADGVNCTEEEHQMNRRTEFKVIGFNTDQPVIYSGQE